MTTKNWVRAIAVATALAVGGNAYAQTKPTDESMYKRTGDFMLVSDYMHPIDKDNTTSIDSILRGGNVTSYYAIDAMEGLKSRLQFLKTEEAKKFYSKEQINDLTLRYLGFIQDIKKEKAKSPKSLETLSRASSDGTISPSEIKDVEDGTYMIVKEGTDKKVGKYAVFALVNLENKSQKASGHKNYTEQELVADEYKQGKHPISVKDALDALPEEKVNPVWSLIAGANVNSDFNQYGLSSGLRISPFKDENIGLGLTTDVGLGKDKQIDSQRIPLSRGKEFIGETNEIDNQSLGFSAELQLHNIILGGGVDYLKHISETNEKVIRGEEVLESNTNSSSKGKIYGKGYIGIEFQPTKKWGVGATMGYHGKNKLQFGIRNTIKINKRK